MVARRLPPGIAAQIMRVARVALPLGAVALLSTVFLLPSSIDPQRAVELADIDVAEITREPRIGSARFAGVMQDDTELIVRAQTVRSRGELTEAGPLYLTLEAPEGELLFPAGRMAQFQGAEGVIDQVADLLVLRGDVLLETSDGYRMAMPELRSALGHTHVQGFGGITGHGPPGEISANTLELRAKPGTEGGYLLAFQGDVRLIYLPDE